jgi:CDP-glucose 4,6-dehydratase
MIDSLSPYFGKKILITGHTGFKGTWLARILTLAGAEVFGLSLEPTENSLFSRIGEFGLQSSNFIDICDADRIDQYFSVNKFEGVFHLAAQSIVIKSYDDPVKTFATNVMGTVNLLNSIKKFSAANWVVVVTTDKVYKNSDKHEGYSENDPIGGSDPYSASKGGTEMVVLAWQNLVTHVYPPIKIVSVRAGNVIGGGDETEYRLMPDLVRGYRTSTKAIIRFPDAVRPWQHVLDPLNGYLQVGVRLMFFEEISQSYNFGPGDESKLSVKDVVEYASSILDQHLDWELRPNLEGNKETSYLWITSERARLELGWFNKYEAKEAIQLTFDWEKESLISNPLNALDIQINNFYRCAL